MKCPHCTADLLRKQRTGQRCSRCKRVFALDPKTNALRLHDLRMQHLVSVLTDPGTGSGRPPAAQRPLVGPLRYTADQLRFAASRKVLTGRPKRSGAYGLLVPIGIAAIVFWSKPGILAALAVLAGIVVLIPVLTAAARRHPGDPLSRDEFAGLIRRWATVYGSPPPGLLPPRPPGPAAPPGRPHAVVYCTAREIVDFLVAAGLPGRRGVMVVPAGFEAELQAAVAADPALPVLVLHDADPAGHLTVGRLRGLLPPGTRIVEVGLRAASAAKLGNPLLRSPDRDELAALGSSVSDAERAWLAKGCAYPLAMLRPARLLSTVERAVDRATATATAAGAGAGAADDRDVAELGFLHWPAA
jgi:hypothetical protein